MYKGCGAFLEKSDSQYFDALKGVGMICIVLGHSCYFAMPYVYSFHLALFFFISGYFYSEAKYGDAPFTNLAARIKSNWLKYAVYCMLFGLLYNKFIKYELYSGGRNMLDRKQLFQLSLNGAIFGSSNGFTGALWFVPVLILASGLFGMAVYLGRCAERIIKTKYIKIFVISTVSILLGLLGVYLHFNEIRLIFVAEAAALVVPVYLMAYLAKMFFKDITRYIKWYGAAVCTAALVYLVKFRGMRVELSAKETAGGWGFYLLAVLGIYSCMFIVKVLCRLPPLRYIAVKAGKYSFEIMALHFLIQKVIDLIYGKYIMGYSNSDDFTAFPYAFKNLWWAYLLLGVALPVLFGVALDCTTGKIKAALNKRAVPDES